METRLNIDVSANVKNVTFGFKVTTSRILHPSPLSSPGKIRIKETIKATAESYILCYQEFYNVLVTIAFTFSFTRGHFMF